MSQEFPKYSWPNFHQKGAASSYCWCNETAKTWKAASNKT